MAAESYFCYIGSAVELLISKSFFTMGQVSSVVAVSVVFEDLGCLASIESFIIECCDD